MPTILLPNMLALSDTRQYHRKGLAAVTRAEETGNPGGPVSKAVRSHYCGEVTRWPNGIRHPNSQFAMPPWDCGLSAVQEPETFIDQ